MKWTETSSKKKDGSIEMFQVPVIMDLADAIDNLKVLAGEQALELLNAMLKRRALTSGDSPWVVGPAKGAGMDTESRKAKLVMSRKAKKASQVGKDALLKELLSGGITPADLRERLEALGIKV